MFGDDKERTCPSCGAPIDPDAYGGLCPACLIGNAPDPSEVETDAGDDAPYEAPSPGDLDRALPEYEVTEIIGRGGMGTVYRARQFELDRDVAIKLLARRPDKESAGNFAERFAREAQVTAQLDHPAIVPVHNMGYDAEGRCFYTMRLVRGRDFSKVIALVEEGGRTWNLPRALDVLVRVCQAVAYAHAKGVIHRDIKPPNVMVGELGEVYVLDWGLAKFAEHEDLRDIRLELGAHQEAGAKIKLTDATTAALRTLDGAVIGTPAYMSPEQAAGKIDQVDHLADVYSLGAMLYHLLARHPPYMPTGSDSSPVKVLSDLLDSPPEKLPDLRDDAPPELVAICDKAMARERPERYPTALGLAEDIQAYLDGRVVGAFESGGLAALRKWVKRNRALASAAMLALLCLVGGLIATAIVQSKANKDISASLAKEKAAKLESQRTLAASYVNQGIAASEVGRYGAAGLWFAHAAIASREEPELHALNRRRFAHWHRQTPRVVTAVDLGKNTAVQRLDFHPAAPRFLLLEHAFDNQVSIGYSVLDLETGLAVVPGEGARPVDSIPDFTAAAWHPNEPIAALSRKPGEIVVWDFNKAEPVLTITPPGDPAPVTALAWSGDGRLFFAVEKTVYVWDRATAKLSEKRFAHDQPVYHIAFTPTSSRLLTAMSLGAERSHKYLLSVFDLNGASTEPRFAPLPHQRSAYSLPPTFIGGGARFYTVAERSFETRDAATGAALSAAPVGEPCDLHPSGTAAFQHLAKPARSQQMLQFSHPSRVSSDGSLLVDVEDAVLVSESNSHPPRPLDFFGNGDLDFVAFSPDDTRFATIGDTGVLRVFDLAADQPARFVETEAAPGELLLSPDGAFVVGRGQGTLFSPPAIASLQVCEVATGKLVGLPIEAGANVTDSAFSSDGSLLALVAGDTVQVVDWRDGSAQREPLTLPVAARNLAFSPGDESLAVLCVDGRVFEVKLGGGPGTLAFEVPARNLHVPYSGLEFHGSTLVAWGLSEKLVLWDWEKREALAELVTHDHSPALAISHAGVIGWHVPSRIDGSGGAFVSTTDGSVQESALDYEYVGWAGRASFSPDGALFMISGQRDFAKAWDWRTGEAAGPDIFQPSSCAEFVPGTPFVITADHLDLAIRDQTRQARLSELATGQLVAPPVALPVSAPWGLAVTPDGQHAIIGDLHAPGYHIVDLARFRTDDPLLALDAAEMLELAELTASARLEGGKPTRVEGRAWFERWQKFATAHPGLVPPVVEHKAKLKRWHAWNEGRWLSHQQDWLAAWHRAKLDALVSD